MLGRKQIARLERHNAVAGRIIEMRDDEIERLKKERKTLRDKLRDAERKARLVPTPGPNAPRIEAVRDGTITQLFVNGTPLGHVMSVEHTIEPDCVPITTIKMGGVFLSRDATTPERTDLNKPCAWKGKAGWIDWHGGECPVPGDTLVDIRFRNGVVRPNDRAADWNWNWNWEASRNLDIVAYRVSE